MWKQLTSKPLRHASLRNRIRRGAAIVEAAMVMPVFFLAILGIIEFGRGMMVSQIVTNGAREGARRAVMDGSSNSAVTGYIRSTLAGSLGVPTSAISVSITITPDPDNNTVGNDLTNAQAFDLVTVRVTVPYNQVGLFAGRYLAGTSIRGETTMRHE